MNNQNTNHDESRELEWLLKKRLQGNNGSNDSYEPYYGDVTELNTCRLIMDSVGVKTLRQIAEDAIDLLETSVAIYEANGDYAFGMFSSGWCQLMDSASRKLCKTDDNRKALICGSWLCHENCWNDSAKVAIESGHSTDIKCVGGIHLYSEPIYAGKIIVGAINIGYGAPPTNSEHLKELADTFNIDFTKLKAQASSYEPRPHFLVDLAKKRLKYSAGIIGGGVKNSILKKTLQQNEERYKSAQRMGKVGNWEYDLRTESFWGSDQAKRIYGFDPGSDRFTTDEVENCIPEREQVHQALINLIEKNTPYNLEFDIHPISGPTTKTIRSIAEIVKDENGSPLKVLGVIQDITEQKKTEDDLRTSEERLSAVLEGSQLGYWDWDMKTGEVVRNKQWASMLGYTLEEVDFNVKQWTDLHHPDDREAVWKSIQGHIEGRTPEHKIEYRMRTKEGSYKWILDQAQIVSYDSDGNPLRMSGTHTDITERKKLENQLLQSQKLESIGNLAGGIAHEFNNILSIIIGNNELIMDDLPEWSLSTESCEEIRVAGLRARDIVKHLLTFSRQDDSIKRPIDTVSVVKESLKLIQATTPANIEIQDNISTECGPVLGDATQINQILINLCNNAVDALPISGGKIDIELCNSDINQDNFLSKIKLPTGKYVKLLVRDNGSGIDKSILDRIFEPYFTTKDIGKGSGIGLAVVHGIVENHGGSIVCDSSKYHGTTFTILIPAYEGTVEIKSDKKDINSGNGEKILYVDDEPSIAKLGQRHLKALGYDAYSTTDPQEALEMIKAEPNRFNLVVSDMAMPNMPGDQLIAEILSINSKMPTMICSGYTSRMSETKASEMGIKAFVMKPFNKAELAKKVKEVLNGSSNQS